MAAAGLTENDIDRLISASVMRDVDRCLDRPASCAPSLTVFAINPARAEVIYSDPEPAAEFWGSWYFKVEDEGIHDNVYFARNLPHGKWVTFADLPTYTIDKLWLNIRCGRISIRRLDYDSFEYDRRWLPTS